MLCYSQVHRKMIQLHTHTHTRTHMHVCTHVHTHMHVRTHVCVYIFLFRFFSIRDYCKVLFLCSTVDPCWLSNSLVWIGFPDDSVVKNPCVIQEAQVWSLGREYLLEGEMTILSSILAGKSHEKRILAGYSPWGHKEPDATEHTPNVPTNSVRLIVPDS